jgi:hypothetical protein
VALGLPIADTLLAIVRRALRGAPLFVADRDHIHHRLLRLGLSHRQAVLAMYGASMVLGAAALVQASSTPRLAWVIAGAIALAEGLVLRRIGYLRFERLREVLGQRRRNLDLRCAIRQAGQRLRGAAEVEEVWKSVKSGAQVLGAGGVKLEILGGAVRGAPTALCQIFARLETFSNAHHKPNLSALHLVMLAVDSTSPTRFPPPGLRAMPRSAAWCRCERRPFTGPSPHFCPRVAPRRRRVAPPT